MLRKDALRYYNELVSRLNSHDIFMVGSLRRGAKIIYDLDMIVIPGDTKLCLRPPKPGDRLRLTKINFSGPRHISYKMSDIKTGKQFNVDIFIVTKRELPFAMFHWTGPAKYNIRTRARAKKMGWLLNQYGLYDLRTARRIIPQPRTERTIALKLGLTPRGPTNRGL